MRKTNVELCRDDLNATSSIVVEARLLSKAKRLLYPDQRNWKVGRQLPTYCKICTIWWQIDFSLNDTSLMYQLSKLLSNIPIQQLLSINHILPPIVKIFLPFCPIFYPCKKIHLKNKHLKNTSNIITQYDLIFSNYFLPFPCNN